MLSSNTSAVSGDANYIEDVFSTYLWTGTDLTQTITNNIDLSTEGGLVWMKRRDASGNHGLFDTLRGQYILSSNLTSAQSANSQISSFNTTGFTLEAGGDYNSVFGGIGEKAVGWTFRKQPKFFDVVTYTGDGSNNRTIAHSLGSTPGFIVVKRTDTSANWTSYHASRSGKFMLFGTTDAEYADTGGNRAFNTGTAMSSTTFSVGAYGNVNASGGTYVAYLFAHNAGGFGLTGTDNVITCGMYTKGTDAYVNLGWEPQWVMVKPTNVSGQSWFIQDNMRGMPATSGANQCLFAESSSAESGVGTFNIDATGFTPTGFANGTQIIYIAIRRGPMKVPTDATKVFAPVTYTGNSTNRSITAGFPVDLVLVGNRGSAASKFVQATRLTGNPFLVTSDTAAESADTAVFQANPFDNQTSVNIGAGNSRTNLSGSTYVLEAFKRAPSFFDEVCFTGTSNAYLDRLNHNLGVAPELIIVKKRSAVNDWYVYSSSSNGGTNPQNYYLYLDGTNALVTGTNTWGNVTPNSSTFAFYADNGATYVSYLFATCPGVSKVGSYTGTGTTKQVDCGFSAGARFVLIKRTDSTGDWYVWDTARGIVSGNDPYLLLNSTAAEVTTTDYIDTYSAGFELSSTAPAALNASGGTYIFLAIA